MTFIDIPGIHYKAMQTLGRGYATPLPKEELWRVPQWVWWALMAYPPPGRLLAPLEESAAAFMRMPPGAHRAIRDAAVLGGYDAAWATARSYYEVP